MRSFFLALALAAIATSASAQDAHDFSGNWLAQIDAQGAPLFEMAITDADGRLTGVGRTTPCSTCADAQAFDATWEGRHSGRHVVLATRHSNDPATLYRFEGMLNEDESSISGVVFHRGEQSPFTMEKLRERNGAVAGAVAPESH